jgi:hypothetical protein
MARGTGASEILEPWREAIRASTAKSYWPGPWSIKDSDRGVQLVGRDDEAADITYAVLDHPLVVLTGSSGVGKTSLLHLKIVAELHDRGFFVAICDNWGDAPAVDADDDEHAVSQFLRRALRSSFESQGITIGDDDILRHLDTEYGSRAVIILDQFEEVIRQRPTFFSRLQDWIENAVETSQVRLVLSLRSEYAYRLTELEVNPYRRRDIEVAVLSEPAVIAEIIRAGRRLDGSSDVIEDAAVDALLDLWQESGATTRAGRVRLLHLQAALFVLWERSRDPRHVGELVTKKDVDNLEERAREWMRKARKQRRSSGGRTARMSAAERQRDHAVAFFDFSISEVVDNFLTRAQKAFTDVMEDELTERGMDDVLLEGVLGVLVRVADYLSSGGYKVDQDHIHLAELALHDELDTLGFLDDDDDDDSGEELARGIIRAFARLIDGDTELVEGGVRYDWVSAPSRVLRAAIRESTLADFPEPWETDTAGVSAGPLMGQSAQAVLVEECRRYFLALEWLETGELVRISSTDDGSSIVALTHDGFGLGMNEWANDHDADMATDLHRITAAVGEVFVWPDARKDVASVNDFTSAENRKVNKRFLNLRWRSCQVVGVHFERVVFVNCDFRGTQFERCSFEGVSFVNCVLNSVQFDHCEFIGPTVELEQESEQGRAPEDRMPSFVDDLAEDVRLFARYSDVDLPGANVIFSAGSGIAAVPAVGTRRKDDTQVVKSLQVRLTADGEPITATTTVDDQDGGIVFYGGRVSSVAFYGCTFPEKGEVSFRHARGSSIDFLEHRGGRIELYDVYLRGVSVTTPVLGRQQGGKPQQLGFQALDSHLENIWFSIGLEGAADFQRSSVWQLFNGSAQEKGGFRVRNGEQDLNDFTGHIGVISAGPTAAPTQENVARYAELIDFQDT